MQSARESILVVDDDPMVIDLVSQLLGEEGYRIDSAGDGRDALEGLKQHLPDVILLDLMMPRMDGFSVLSALQSDATLRDIPVVVLTAKSLSQEERKLLKERSLAVIHKQGLEREQLLKEVETASQAVGG